MASACAHCLVTHPKQDLSLMRLEKGRCVHSTPWVSSTAQWIKFQQVEVVIAVIGKVTHFTQVLPCIAVTTSNSSYLDPNTLLLKLLLLLL